jgi:SAM-dependent methyltransferase
MTNDQTKKFYDELSADYHLIFGNWYNAIKRQSKILDNIIQKYSKKDSKTLLDCSCGIGTQAIGLANLGYKVHATDLSPKAIERAKQEADKINVSMSFGVADFKKLENQVKGVFDIVISCDNSLPHLLTDKELLLAAKNILSKMKANSLFIASIRDYDQLLEDKPIRTQPSVKDFEEERTISFQVWDWGENNVYTVNHFTLKGINEKFDTFLRTTRYRAYKRDEISKIFEEA